MKTPYKFISTILAIAIVVTQFASNAHLSSVALPLLAYQKAKEEALRPVAARNSLFSPLAIDAGYFGEQKRPDDQYAVEEYFHVKLPMALARYFCMEPRIKDAF